MKRYTLYLLIGLLVLTLGVGINAALARPQAAPAAQTAIQHPNFALLDSNGVSVLESGGAVSTMKTCGQCHDTNFIQSHAFHSDLGLSEYRETKDFNASPGLFGKWDPLTYRYLSQSGDERLDLSTAEWLKLNSWRVVGGGPAETSRNGAALTELQASVQNPETAILQDGKATVWNWNESGTMEMNCFLCHLNSPDVESRAQFIQQGKFGDANTATLLNLNIVKKSAAGWEWNAEAFNANGEVKSELLSIQDPTNENCATCHGEVHPNSGEPLVLNQCDLRYPQSAATGQVISGQKISASGVNLADKNELSFAWDVHAQRQLQCTDCHYALNNPAHVSELQKSYPSHLVYDPRALEINEYLKRPDHNFARGQSAQFNTAAEYKGTMRRCENCHDYSKAHADWLPYIETHMNSMACETCHIPQLYAPAIQTYDWTVITPQGEAVSACRGVEGAPNQPTSLVTGYKPVWLNRTNIDGSKTLTPYNLITSFYWAYDDAQGNKRPAPLAALQAAYLSGGGYAPDIVAAFDSNGDKTLDSRELVIDSPAKEDLVKGKLSALGLNNPRIEGMTQPYSVNHNVVEGKRAISECETCHNADSRATQPIKLADNAPVMPAFDANNNVSASGEIVRGEDGALYYQPKPANDGIYVFGSSRVGWIDWLGALAFVGSLVGALGHATLRYLAARKMPKREGKTKRVYMYEAYRRFWHWLQALGITLLLLTGLVIHRPDIFGAFSFRGVVTVHNVLAVLLALNAALSFFYHVVTAQIQQFIPRPYGFFDDAMIQAKYYISGIFKGEPHPFEKRPDSRMNPIQKATYFAILNVLLPLQGLTGVLMWLVQKYPNVAGGLPFLAPLHSLVAWLFAAFLVVHIYMTTTGATPLEAIRAMVTGYEEVEEHEAQG